MKRTFIKFGLVFVMFSSFLFSGCDTKKVERESLLKQTSTLDSEISRLKEQQTLISNKNNQLKTAITQQTSSLEQLKARDIKLKDSLAEYLLEHKLVTAAIIAMGGAAAGIIDENTDQETKDTLTGVAIIGAVVCLYNAEECADVTAKIIYYGSEIESVKKLINSSTTEISNKKLLLQSNEKEYVSLMNQINGKTDNRNSLQQKHDELVCKFCI
jgi:chromosome segregation ATPase